MKSFSVHDQLPISNRRRSGASLEQLPHVVDCWSNEAFIAECAENLVAALVQCQRSNTYGKILLGLSGGSTPRAVFPEIARLSLVGATPAVDWSRIIVFLVDERLVPPDHPDSNQRLVRDSLLQGLGGRLPEENTIFPDTSLSIDLCVSKYHESLYAVIEKHGVPDLLTLGLGDDGHIASWFPPISDTDMLRAVDPSNLVAHTTTDRFAVRDRISISLDLISESRKKLFFLNGELKIKKWKQTLVENDATLFPALMAMRRGMTTVICYPPLDDSCLQNMQTQWEGEHLTIIVLGASGDLVRKKTMPAIFSLYCEGRLPENFTVVGFARSQMTFEEFWSNIETGLSSMGLHFCEKSAKSGLCQLSELQKLPNRFKSHCTYFCGQYDDPNSFKQLHDLLQRDYETSPKANRIFYLALPPSSFATAVQSFRVTAFVDSGWNRVIVEKPFGHDLDSSNELARRLTESLKEEQIYRIDHYLGKEMVLNVLALRFANSAFSPVWNQHYVSNVRITMKEDIGTAGRGGYFDKVGIIRDVIQNHLLQVLSLIAMERPASLKDEDIRDEKVKVLRQTSTIQNENVVLGQYTAGASPSKQQSYLGDPGVPKDSNCPTFATCVLFVNNERWDGIPFIVKAGKALEAKMTEVRIQLKDVPGSLFGSISRNEFVIKIQPNEAVYLKIYAKNPGLEGNLVQTELDLSLQTRFGVDRIPDAYERLILNCIAGKKQNFVRTDELREAWRIFTPLLHAIDAREVPVLPYAFGSRGPPQSDDLIRSFGFQRTVGYTWKPYNNDGVSSRL